MKHSTLILLLVASSACPEANGQVFTNYIRQVQVSSGAEWDMDVEQSGEELSPLAIDPGGARFELWTLRSSTFQDYLLDHKYVGTYVPHVTITITSEDPYVTQPRTRADRPFTVTMNLAGMSTDPDAPEAARMARVQHHVQAYPEDGDETSIDRSEATLLTDGYIDNEGNSEVTYPITYVVNNVPGDNRAKVRGEERFSAFSIPDYQAPESQLASRHIQIWPVADGQIAGISDGELIRFSSPQITITLNDLYPDSRTYAQLYKGPQALGTIGTVVGGSGVVVRDAVPRSRVLVIDDWDKIIRESGQWTMELLTETPFGIDRLDHVTFEISRDIQVNGSVTTVE